MKWQKLATLITAIVAVSGVAAMAQSVTLKAKVDLKRYAIGTLDKPTKITTKEIVQACADANGLDPNNLLLVFILLNSTDPTAGGSLKVVDKSDVTTVECDVLDLTIFSSASATKVGTTTDKASFVFTYGADNSSLAVTNTPLDTFFTGNGIANGSATVDDASGTVLNGNFRSELNADSDSFMYVGSISVNGKDLAAAP